MVYLLAFAATLFVGGSLLFSAQRQALIRAMEADGFLPHEIRKALRLHARKKRPELLAYCREVVERHARVDRTKAQAYRGLL